MDLIVQAISLLVHPHFGPWKLCHFLGLLAMDDHEPCDLLLFDDGDDDLSMYVSITLSPSLIVVLLHNSNDLGFMANSRSCNFLPSNNLRNTCSSLSHS